MNAKELYAGGYITLKEFIKALALKEQGAPYLGEFMDALNLRVRFGEPKSTLIKDHQNQKESNKK